MLIQATVGMPSRNAFPVLLTSVLLGPLVSLLRIRFPTGIRIAIFRQLAGKSDSRMKIHVPEEGFHRTTFPGGKPSHEYTIKNGQAHGIHRLWHSNGVLAEERRYRHGLLHGMTRQWNTRGELLGTCKFQNGTGMLREWHENGQPRCEMFNLRGGITGRMRIWEVDGMLYLQRYYFNGRPISKKAYQAKCRTMPELPRFKDEKVTNTLGNYLRRIRKAQRDQAKLGPSPEQLEGERLFDESAKAEAKEKDSNELVSWLAKATKREKELGEMSKSQALKLARKLYAVGARRVWATRIEQDEDGAQYSKRLIIALPDAPAKRGKIYDLCADPARPFIGGSGPAIAVGKNFMSVSLM